MKSKNCLGKDIKKILRIGQSLGITLPRDYLKAHNLKQGDQLEVYYNSIIHAEPLNINEIKSKLGKNTKLEKTNNEKG